MIIYRHANIIKFQGAFTMGSYLDNYHGANISQNVDEVQGMCNKTI